MLAFAAAVVSAEDREAGRFAVQTHNAVGVVKSMNPAKGFVTLAHGPVKSLKWPARTATFTIRDKALFNMLKPGAKVEIDFVREGQHSIITAVK